MLNKPETEILRNLKAMEKEQLFPSLLIHLMAPLTLEIT